MMESKTLEYKREYTDDIKYAVVAFANTDGGKLIIGIEDDGRVCGVSDPDGTMLRVANMIRDAIRPDMTLFTEVYAAETEEKPVVVVHVQRGTARPYYLAAKGVRPEGVYVRQGPSSVPASETAILQRWARPRSCVIAAICHRISFHLTSSYTTVMSIPT